MFEAIAPSATHKVIAPTGTHRARRVPVPERLITDTRISDRAVRLWARLAHFAARNEASPPIPRLADDLGCSPASIGRALSELVAAGWVTRETYRDDSGRQQTRAIVHVGGTGAGA